MSDGSNNAMVRRVETAATAFLPVMTIEQAGARFKSLLAIRENVMKRDVDYGIIPGTDKPTLLKPGAEKLNTLFGLTARPMIITQVEDWTGAQHGGEQFFYYLYRYQLSRDGLTIAEADGSANSFETKYRYRWVGESDVPAGLDPAKLRRRDSTVREPGFAIDKGETSGRYGKPAEYWERFRAAIRDNSAKSVKWKASGGRDMHGWEIPGTVYRVPNENIADVVNTIQKIAQKRALIAATLLATNASEFFTQDLEDLSGRGGDEPYTQHDIDPRGVMSGGPDTSGPETSDTSDISQYGDLPDPPHRDPEPQTDSFPIAWMDAITGRRGTEQDADRILAALLRQRKCTSIDQIDGNGRRELIQKAIDGRFDRYIAGAKPPAAAAQPQPGPAQPAAAAVLSPAPHEPEPDLDPLTDLYALDEGEFKRALVGKRHNSIDRPTFEKRFGAYMIRHGYMGPKFKKMPQSAKKSIYNAIVNGSILDTGEITANGAA